MRGNNFASWQTQRRSNFSKYQLHALMTIISKKKKWNLLENCHKYAPKLFWNAYTWHVLEDPIFCGQWTNLHDRSQTGPKPVTNDYLVWSLIFITRVNTNDVVMWETLPNNADWDCFKTPILQEILRIQNPLLEEHCAFLWSHTFVPISWMCEKQTSVSHSLTESGIISLDAGLRLDGKPALDLWGLIVAVLHENTYQSNQERGEPCTNLVRAAPKKLPKRQKSRGIIDLWRQRSIDQDDHKGKKSHNETRFQNQHRVALDWLFDRINLNPKIQIKYIDTQNQLADILTKGNFTRDEWNHLLCLFNISHFSYISHSKIKADDAFGLAIQRKGSERACLDCNSKPAGNQIWKSNTSELVDWAATQERGRQWWGASSSDYS